MEEDEAYVEDVPDGLEDVQRFPKEELELDASSYLRYVMNPWFLMALSFLCYYLVQQFEVRKKLTEWQRRREAAAELTRMKLNPDHYRERAEAMERARQRQQASHDAATAEYVEKERQKEEKKRAKLLEDLERLSSGQGSRNRSLKSSTTESTLGFGGGSSRYRPPRRGLSAGGG